MKSTFTQKTYDYVHSLTANYTRHDLTDLNGVVYVELSDHSWIALQGEFEGCVRYIYTANHGGGISLLPMYELVDAQWFSIKTGEPAPPASSKQHPHITRVC